MPQSLFSSERPILSRVSGGTLVNREAQTEELYRAATSAAPRTVFVAGESHAGKSSLLLTTFDRIFAEADQVLPIWFCAQPDRLSPENLSSDFLFSLLQQFLAFRHNDPQLLAKARLPAADLLALCFPEEHGLVSTLLNSYHELLAAEDEENRQQKLLRLAFNAPQFLAAHTSLRVALLLDEAHLLNDITADGQAFSLLSELIEKPSDCTLIVTGLQRALPEKLTLSPERLSDLWYVWVTPLDSATQQALLEQWCQQTSVTFNRETLRLAAEQMNGNLFYLRSIINAAGERRLPLTDAVEFQHLYIDELLRGRIAQHFSALLRQMARRTTLQPRGEAMSPEIVDVCHDALETVVSTDFFHRRLKRHFAPERLLNELHHHELITLTGDQIRVGDDPVFRDWLFATHQRFTGLPAEEVRIELLSRRMKKLYRLTSRSELRVFNTRITRMLEKFDQQPIPHSLLSHDEFLIRYSRLNYEQILAGLGAEPRRTRLPQMIYVTEASLPENEACSSWSVLQAYGFDGAQYDNAHETVWLVAATSSAKAVTEADVFQLKQCLETVRLPLGNNPRIVRWALGKSGFTPGAIDALQREGFLNSDYLQLELLGEVVELGEIEAAVPEEGAVPAPSPERSDLDIAIPVGQEREIISAGIIEQTTRAAGLSNEQINQLKTAVIEACLSLSAMKMSYDGRIHQRVRIAGEKILVTLATSSLALEDIEGIPLDEENQKLWRMTILQSLTDEVTLQRVPGGVRVILTKIKTPSI